MVVAMSLLLDDWNGKCGGHRCGKHEFAVDSSGIADLDVRWIVSGIRWAESVLRSFSGAGCVVSRAVVRCDGDVPLPLFRVSWESKVEFVRSAWGEEYEEVRVGEYLEEEFLDCEGLDDGVKCVSGSVFFAFVLLRWHEARERKAMVGYRKKLDRRSVVMLESVVRGEADLDLSVIDTQDRY